MADALEHQSGLLGLAGTADMRALLARDDADAKLAVDVYVHRLRSHRGDGATLGGLDALVFTGGVGENSARIRGRLACEGMGHLGIGAPESGRPRTRHTRARDLEIARQARELLAAQGVEQP